ncbi:hypothetical protein BC828DRAFT_438370 [Blastocladiella britannica]|nr:hypothetical protein BC828DRAFT_438370 [Blastocladiella britannica]
MRPATTISPRDRSVLQRALEQQRQKLRERQQRWATEYTARFGDPNASSSLDPAFPVLPITTMSTTSTPPPATRRATNASSAPAASKSTASADHKAYPRNHVFFQYGAGTQDHKSFNATVDPREMQQETRIHLQTGPRVRAESSRARKIVQPHPHPPPRATVSPVPAAHSSPARRAQGRGEQAAESSTRDANKPPYYPRDTMDYREWYPAYASGSAHDGNEYGDIAVEMQCRLEREDRRAQVRDQLRERERLAAIAAATTAAQPRAEQKERPHVVRMRDSAAQTPDDLMDLDVRPHQRYRSWPDREYERQQQQREPVHDPVPRRPAWEESRHVRLPMPSVFPSSANYSRRRHHTGSESGWVGDTAYSVYPAETRSASPTHPYRAPHVVRVDPHTKFHPDPTADHIWAILASTDSSDGRHSPDSREAWVPVDRLIPAEPRREDDRSVNGSWGWSAPQSASGRKSR